VDRSIPDISVVVPVYRSEGSLPALAAAVDKALSAAKLSYELILVNDGSPDRSWLIIKQLATRYPTVVGFCHRRNFGQDNAILTGIRNASGRAVIIMDDDLQHSPDDIPKLYEEMNRSGADVVYAHFIEKKQRAWKRVGSWINGKFAEWLIDKPAKIYMSPFKIIRGEVAELIAAFDGPFPYVDSLLFQVTNRFSFIQTKHYPRLAGSSTYTLMRSLGVWSRLVFSFSVKPLRLVSWVGIAALIISSVAALLIIVARLAYPEDYGNSAVGWASLAVMVLVIGGLQMLFLGILGEYVGRTHININRKPQAVVAETTSGETDRVRQMAVRQ
jgi:undecaprenyl-phosphate 4-deoxy-4-formamido-L-arabinose transferase